MAISERSEETTRELMDHGSLVCQMRREIANRLNVPTFVVAIHEKKADPLSCLNLTPVGQKITGFVYFMESGGFIKIGWALDPLFRLKTISAMSPVPVKIVGMFEGDLKVEKAVHEKFSEYRHHGEWFSKSPEIVSFIEQNKDR
jgi:hypothetical protein